MAEKDVQSNLMDLLGGESQEVECQEKGCQEQDASQNASSSIDKQKDKQEKKEKEAVKFDDTWVVSYYGRDRLVRDLHLKEYSEKELLKALSKDIVALTVIKKNKIEVKYNECKKLILVLISADRKG